LFLIGAISVIMLIIGGIRYTVSAGDSGNVTAAKSTIMYAIIGLIVAFLAFAIVNWVLKALTNG
jgi:multisubunit Na+/H+ antiporter MnhB subunit